MLRWWKRAGSHRDDGTVDSLDVTGKTSTLAYLANTMSNPNEPPGTAPDAGQIIGGLSILGHGAAIALLVLYS